MQYTIAQMRKMVARAYEESLGTAELLRGDTNPQVVATYLRAVGEYQAFDAVLQALKGDAVTLKIFGRTD